MNQGLLIDVAPYAGNDDEDVRYTLDEADLWLRTKAGVDRWDLDAAACNESHRAPAYYTLERSENGLVLPWCGAVFCNPPWSDIEPWIARAQLELSTNRFVELVGFMLPLRTHRPWWQKYIEPHFAEPPYQPLGLAGQALRTCRVHHPPTRFRYGCPGNPRGVGMPEPNFQSVGVVFRRAC